ncbi:ABC transporter permease [Fodinisporobacter ferrooxydans]|uniref:ABC transporter permease n=1 Tax=Fodinisporobacter ferrooxydans TaxID=2901836 RepID=A0ABY4CGX2_9BACL|nr:ABC transporter permease [Alicyclobacillaceae bacterium MYW30-H2]
MMEWQANSHIITIEGSHIQDRKAEQREKQRQRVLKIVSPVFLLILWQAADMIQLLNPMFFPAPTTIAASLWHDILTIQVITDIKSSLVRILAGFIAGAVPGVLLGLSIGLFPLVRTLVEPIVATLYPIPKLALMPIVMLLFGLGEKEKVIVILLGVIFPVIINTAAGVMNLDKRYLDVAKNFGASRLDYYRTIALPGSLGMIFTGLRLGIGMAVLLIVAAEMHGANSGIGYRIWTAYDMFDINTMFESFLLLALLGYLLTVAVDEMEQKVIPWRRG